MFTNDTDLTLKGEFVNLRTRFFNETFYYRQTHEKEGIDFGFDIVDITFSPESYQVKNILHYTYDQDHYYEDLQNRSSILGENCRELHNEESMGFFGDGTYCDCCGVVFTPLNSFRAIYGLCVECDIEQETQQRFKQYQGVKIDDIFVVKSNNQVYTSQEDYEDAI